MLGNAIAAPLFYCLIVGLFITSRSKRDIELNDFILELAVNSLFVSWALVFVSYILSLPDLFYVWAGALIVVLWRYPIQARIKVNKWTVVNLIILILLAVYLFTNKYTLAFRNWDAVVSWNRWAEELSMNDYFAGGNIYPVFFPGLWALIYKAVGGFEHVVVAKTSLMIMPVMVFLSHLRLYRIHWWLGAVASFFLGYIFLFAIEYPLLNGYMDGPVTACIGACILIWLYSSYLYQNEDKSEWTHNLLILAMLVGISAVVKQAGLVILTMFIVFQVVLYLKSLISRNQLTKLLLLALFPFISFIVMYLLNAKNMFGNMPVLRNLVEEKSKGNIYIHSLNQMVDFMHWIPVVLMLVLSLVNFLKPRKTYSGLGIILFVFTVVGFVSYANCCSYDFRNGWWLLMVLFGSTLTGLLTLHSYMIKIHSDGAE